MTTGDNFFPGDPGPINNTGGFVIVNGNADDDITNTGGSVTVKDNANTGITIDNSGGAIVVGQNANGVTFINNCNITIGNNGNNSNTTITDGLFSVGNSFQNSTIEINNSVFILPASNLTRLFGGLLLVNESVANLGSGNNALLIDIDITGTGDQDYSAINRLIVNDFDYNDDTIVVPDTYGPYTATFAGTTLTIVGTGGGGVTYEFRLDSSLNVPAGPTSLIVVPSLDYQFITPDAADDISMGPDLTDPPTPTNQSYDGYYYFGAMAPVIPPCAVICYSGESVVLAKNTTTGAIDNIKIRNLYAGVHDVYSEQSNKFVPVKHNIIAGQTKRYMLIKKDMLGPNQPSEDFYVTSGHKVVYNGVIMKARRVPNAKRIRVSPPETIYTICTEEPDILTINGMSVCSWGRQEWISCADKKNIAWKENKKAVNAIL